MSYCLNNIRYAEIGEIRTVIEEKRNQHISLLVSSWDIKDPEEIKEIFERGYKETNPFCRIGRYNRILIAIDNLDSECKKAMGWRDE